MNTFDDRQKAFEAEFARDAALQFKTEARRNKLLGLFIAEKLGKSGDDAEAYAKTVVIADMEEVGDDDVVRKVRADLDAAGINFSDDDIRAKLAELMPVAFDQIKAGE